jgi:hypothetical protein
MSRIADGSIVTIILIVSLPCRNDRVLRHSVRPSGG